MSELQGVGEKSRKKSEILTAWIDKRVGAEKSRGALELSTLIPKGEEIMTHSIKKTAQSPAFEMGDRVRLKKRFEGIGSTPISRKSVGTIGDVLISPVDGGVAYRVAFPKEMETPLLSAEELVKLPPKTAKTKTNAGATTPPKVPDDVKASASAVPPRRPAE